MKGPIANTTTAVDFVFWFIVIVSVILLLLVTGLMIYFAFKYHRSRHPEPKETKESTLLEVAWTLIPTLIVLVMFWYGYRAFMLMQTVPADALVVKTTGQMWRWTFEYPNGKKSDVLYVPSEKAVKIELISTDVLHGFYVPAFRVKQDVLPGRTTYLWFKPQGYGPAHIFCSQFCGIQHAYMIGTVMVMDQADFDAWLASPAALPAVPTTVDINAPGYKLMEKYNCFTCHRLDNTKGIGPSLKGLAGSKVTVLVDGQPQEVTADAAYLARSILDPMQEVVKGYPNIMARPQGITDADAQTMAQFLTTLK